MTTDNISLSEEKALFEQLVDQLRRGREDLKKGNVKGGQVQMWTGAVRHRLITLYGKESEIVACLPTPAADKVPPDKASEILSQRLSILTSFLERIHADGMSSFCKGAGKRIFIGHGRSLLWRELKDFLQDRLHLAWDEFNREAVAGFTTFERISEMLDSATFAFLIMTAEDEHLDSSVHPRENVVHELGLFHGRLGPRRAIILMEEGCSEFSNIVGLSQIRFPKGYISSAFEEIRRVLEREGLI
jgi:hypothetical protein